MGDESNCCPDQVVTELIAEAAFALNCYKKHSSLSDHVKLTYMFIHVLDQLHVVVTM